MVEDITTKGERQVSSCSTASARSDVGILRFSTMVLWLRAELPGADDVPLLECRLASRWFVEKKNPEWREH